MQGSIRGYTISVPSLADSVAWYETKLGFEKLDELVWPGVGRTCMMQGPGFTLEIVETGAPQPAPASESHPDSANQVNGHKHFCFSTASAARAADELGSAGVKIVCTKDVADFTALFILDNAGCLIELLQNKAQPAATADPDGRAGSPLAQSLHHVAISVPDYRDSCDWYAEVLGLAKVAEFAIPEVGLTVAMVAGANGTVELFQAADASPLPAYRRSPIDDLSTVGNKYFHMVVDDVAGAAKSLGNSGISVTEPQLVGKTTRAFMTDNSGLAIQLIDFG